MTEEEELDFKDDFDALRRSAERLGIPLVMSFFDGDSKVCAIGDRKDSLVYIHSGDFSKNPNLAGDIMVSIDAKTLQRILPQLMHALNVALGAVPEPKDSDVLL
jgi:hypothetical protein